MAQALGRSSRWVRQWVAENVPEPLQERRDRAQGGSPELWLHADAVAQLQALLGSGSSSGGAVEAAAESVESVPLLGSGSSGTVAGWREALEAERSRAQEALDQARRAEVRADAVAADLRAVRVELDQAQRRAEEADAGRHAAQRALEQLRADVWAWVAQLRGRTWWRRLGRLPDPPPGLEALDRRIEQRRD